MKKVARFFVSVKNEMKKVKWPEKKQMITYSIATLAFILIFSLFFGGLDIIISGIKVVVK